MRPMKLRTALLAALVAAATSLSTPARALPGFYAAKGGGGVATSDATHVVIMKKGDASVVTVMPDYKGDLRAFAFVMPVPGDATLERVRSMRRDFVDRVDQISAPRFHEFWEMDPCDTEKPEQMWEVDMTAKSDTAFLGGDGMGLDKATRKVAKELRMDVEPQYKEAEYTFTVLGKEQGAGDIARWLKQKGYTAPDGVADTVKKYVNAGMNLLVAEVDDKKIELVGGRRAILSPIRYATKKPVTIASTLGLATAKGEQELTVYVLDPERRSEVKGYDHAFPPTNVEVDFKVKERVGEFYAGIHDLVRAKNAKTFLVEYAWPTSGCGEPCPNEKLMIHELLTLGGDFFEEDVPDAEKNPKPPEMTEEEKTAYDALETPDDKKRFEQDRKEVLRRQGLIQRHAYVLTRLHHRYGKEGLPHDIEVQPAPHVQGGVDLPKGVSHELSTNVGSADRSKFQTRFNHFHPNKVVVNCENPQHGRWGKPPRTYRGLRKVWVAQDLATKNRTSIKPADMVRTPVPALGLAGAMPKAADAGTAAANEKDGKACGCRAVGRGAAGGVGWAAVLGLGVLAARRRRAR
jgi:MYXO-CTERM domain-containing protein